MKRLKVGDILVYAILVLLALVGFGGMRSMATESNQREVVILLDGREIERIPLKKSMEPAELRIDAGDGHYNVVYIDYDGARVTKASCSDSLCIRQGNIEHSGQSIVCLPNKVVIKIVGDTITPPVDDITCAGRRI